MKKYTILILPVILFTILSCSKKKQITGKFTAQSASFIKSIEFDGEVAITSGLMSLINPGAGKYDVKGDRLYIETGKGFYVFEIIDNETLMGKSALLDSITYKNE